MYKKSLMVTFTYNVLFQLPCTRETKVLGNLWDGSVSSKDHKNESPAISVLLELYVIWRCIVFQKFNLHLSYLDTFLRFLIWFILTFNSHCWTLLIILKQGSSVCDIIQNWCTSMTKNIQFNIFNFC